MGNGIAQASAASGYQVMMCDLSGERLDAGIANIRRSLDKLLARKKITREEYDATLGNLKTTTDIGQARDAELVIEAVTEKLAIKKAVFGRLDEICSPHSILGTNTSAIPITSIASATSRPDRVVGMHFFFPVPRMRLCEIMAGLLTSHETMLTASAWVKSLGKETILIYKDHAGFIANRINLPISIEAVRLVDEGIATPEEIDRATGGNDLQMGIIQLMDYGGLDTAFNAFLALYEDTREARFFPPPLLRRMVAAGLLGRKAGRGFYDYSSGKRESYMELSGNRTVVQSDEERQQKYTWLNQRIFMPSILEAVRALEAGIASVEDIDKAACLGMNLPFGQLEMADNMGLDAVNETAMAFYKNTGEAGFFPPPLLRRMVTAGLLGRKTNKGFYDYPPDDV
jgi:3-hydroxyacyl-CoA dehydrogenase